MPTQLRSRASFLTQSDWLEKKADQSLCIRKEALGTRLIPTKTRLSYQQKCSALLKCDLLIQKIQSLVYRKKLILICELGYVRGIMHFRIQSALLDCSFPILVCYIRLVYRTSNFQTVAIVLTSFVKDTFCPQLHQSNSKFTWLATKKRTKVLGIGNSFLYQYFIL